ncbi:MAG: phage scaffolding protein [Oscillospiraceae bacterium]|nr:phage scaffolding protein [Oscillospiraceae bacterium]
MKKEELLEIGLTEEQANKIFALNGQDVEREKAKTTAAKAELADAQGKLSAATTELETLKKTGGDAASIQQQLASLQSKYDQDTSDLRNQLADRDYSDAVRRAIAGKGLKFSSKSAERAFAAALKERKLELKDGELAGLDDFIKAQREADPDAFAPDKAPPRFLTGSGGGGGHGAPPENVPENVRLAKELGAARAANSVAASDVLKNYL